MTTTLTDINATATRSSGASFGRRAAAVVLVLAFVLSARAMWHRAGDLIIDTGRELDTPRQLVEGRLLYRDVRYWYGPFAPYFHALLYRLFGVHADVLAAAGVGVAAATTWIFYRLARLLASRAAAAIAGVAFILLCAFGQCYTLHIFNFMMPYAFPATYGLLFAVLGTYAAARYLRKQRSADLLVAALALALTALCKLETLFAAGASHAAFLLLLGWTRRGRWSVVAASYAEAIVGAGAVYAWFFHRVGGGLFSDNLLISGNLTAREFLLLQSGLVNTQAVLTDAARSLALLGGCLLMGRIVGWVAHATVSLTPRPAPLASGDSGDSAPDPFAVRLTWSLVTISLGVVGWALLLPLFWWIKPLALLRGVPVVVAGTLLVLLVNALRDPVARPIWSPAILATVFALAGLPRILGRCGPEHYGFYLFGPALVIWSVLACDWAARRRGGRAVSAVMVGCLTTLTIVAAVRLEGGRVAASVRAPTGDAFVRGPRGTFLCPLPYQGAVDRAIEFLSRQSADTRVVAFPEGAAIGFVAGCRNPVGLHTFLPLDFSGSFDESGMIERLERGDPDFVLLTTRDTREYGKRAFGVGYAERLAGWIVGRFTIAEEFRGAAFAVRVLKKR